MSEEQYKEDKQALNDLRKLSERGTNATSDESVEDTENNNHNKQRHWIVPNPTKIDLWCIIQAKKFVKNKKVPIHKTKTRSNHKNKIQQSVAYKIAVDRTKNEIRNAWKEVGV